MKDIPPIGILYYINKVSQEDVKMENIEIALPESQGAREHQLRWQPFISHAIVGVYSYRR